MRERFGGVVAALRGGSLRARAGAVLDSRNLVRVLFLASAVELEVLESLRSGCDLGQLCDDRGWTRRDRVEAWLRVGVETGELRVRDGRYELRGVRIRALVEGDDVLRAHYRSVIEYQAAAYATLHESFAGTDRNDLARYADTIATVSRAAEPFLRVSVARASLDATRILDVGCGTGVYLAAALLAAPAATGMGVDLAADAITITGRLLAASGLSGRAELRCGDVRAVVGAQERFDLVLVMNSIYYVPPPERAAFIAALAGRIDPGGSLLIATMVVPGSIAAAHLDLLLRVQGGAAALPTATELTDLGRETGLVVEDLQRPVPTEPFVVLRARLPR